LESCDGDCIQDFYCENPDGSLRLYERHYFNRPISYEQCAQAWKATRDACTPGGTISNPPCTQTCDIRMRYEAPAGCSQCGLNASFEGERGVHEFLIDLKDKSGILGVWFNTEDKPDRFSLHWPLTSTNQPQSSLPEFTSGWRGDKNQAASISGLSNSSPYLRYPKSHGPVFYNGSFNNGPQAIIGQEILGPIRQNENWGYFLFLRTPQQAASGQGRYARLVVEAPLEDTKWYCGLICDTPTQMPICWGEAGPVSTPGSCEALWDSGCGIGTMNNIGAIGDLGEKSYISPDGPVENPPGAGGSTYVIGAHDWKASVELGLTQDLCFGSLATAMPNDVVEALYHPQTGLWISTKLRLCATSAERGPSDGSAGCTTSGWANGEQVNAIDPGGTTYGLVNAAAGTAQAGVEPPRGPGGVG
jgi:hypothetical protein